jgi:hypothetical protein
MKAVKEDEYKHLDFHDDIIVLNVFFQGIYEVIQYDPIVFVVIKQMIFKRIMDQKF